MNSFSAKYVQCGNSVSARIYRKFLPSLFVLTWTYTACAQEPISVQAQGQARDGNIQNQEAGSANLNLDLLKSAIIAQISPKIAQQQEQSGWNTLKVHYDVWLPESAARLPSCQKALDITLSGRLRSLWGRQNYRVNCPGSMRWQLRAQLTVTAELPVWTASSTILKDQSIQPSEVELKTVNLDELHQKFSVKTDSPVALRTKRMIPAGQIIDPDLLQKPLLIHRGDLVWIQAQSGGLSASMQGEALEDGMQGAVVLVRNQSSGKEVQAEVKDKGIVQVHF